MKRKNKKRLAFGLATILLFGSLTCSTVVSAASFTELMQKQGVNTSNMSAVQAYMSDVIADANNGKVSDTESKILKAAIKTGSVTYTDGKWKYQAITTQSQYAANTQERQNIANQALTNLVSSSSSSSSSSSDATTPETQQATYSGDEIAAAVERANNGTSQDGDSDILTYAQDNALIETSSNGTYTQKAATNSWTWTIYAQLLMADKDSEQSHSILGDGDVSVDLPYADISKDGNSIAKETTGSAGESGNKVGTKAAAILATFSHYNYFETVSGNSIAVATTSFVGSIGRWLGGIIALISSILVTISRTMLSYVADFLVTFNPYAIIWNTSSTVASSNPVAQAATSVLTEFGFNKNNLKIIFSVTFIVITGVFAFRLMRNISGGGITGRGIFDPTKKWFYRIVPVFIMLPLFALCSGYLIKSYQQSDLITSDVGVGIDYLVNARYWADSSNLSPNGGYNKSAPYATSEDGYIDDDYAPYTSTGKANIENINRTSYQWATGDTSISDEDISRRLIMAWISNQTFNVNTWAADVRVSDTSEEGSARTSKATIGDTKDFIKVGDGKTTADGYDADDPANPNKLGEYIWSVQQSPDKTQTTPTSYNSKLQVGSYDGFSWSTQSVALILQSSFNDSGAQFYAYNISPTGTQAAMKSLSTVKTQWKEVSMVGTNGVGQFSSWVGMIGGYLALFMINISVIMAIFHTGIIDALGSFLASAIKTVFTGNPVEAAATFMYFVAMLGIGILALSMGSLVYTATTIIARGLNNLVEIDALAGLLEGGISIVVAYILAFSDGERGHKTKPWQTSWGKTPITRLFKAIIDWAKNAHHRLQMMMPNDMMGRHFGYAGMNGYYSDARGSLINPYVKDRPSVGRDWNVPEWMNWRKRQDQDDSDESSFDEFEDVDFDTYSGDSNALREREQSDNVSPYYGYGSRDENDDENQFAAYAGDSSENSNFDVDDIEDVEFREIVPETEDASIYDSDNGDSGISPIVTEQEYASAEDNFAGNDQFDTRSFDYEQQRNKDSFDYPNGNQNNSQSEQQLNEYDSDIEDYSYPDSYPSSSYDNRDIIHDVDSYDNQDDFDFEDDDEKD